ncbi:amidase [Rhizobium sp. AAP43]|uniref:amidase n=1 Tax=Rhizobium sp. AAP43 TaxID=1523420 RepID=UPI0006B98745|nr:amidase [Rhizobium sp. AAP43]
MSADLPSHVEIRPQPLVCDVASVDATDLLSAYADGALTPVEALADLHRRIEADNKGQGAVLRFASGWQTAAEESAARWKSGQARPLEGLPFGVKDIIDVDGTLTTSGSWFTGDRIAQTDADVVARLRQAGAIPFAMLATTEFACGSPHNPRFGTVGNPFDPSRWTGGSSTGSGAVLAARLMPFALGTDTGGSIRVPSCWCGTTGLKPSRELVSRKGVAPLSWTLDHVGPMTRSARDIARVLPFMAASPDVDLIAGCMALLAEADLTGLRIGVPVNWFTELVDATVLDNWRAALEVLQSLGCTVKPLPVLPVETFHRDGWTVLLSELAAHQSERLPRAELFDRGLLARLNQGITILAADYGRALQRRKAAQDMFLDAMTDIDLLLTPGLGGEAGALDTLTVEVDGHAVLFQDIISRNTMIFDHTGFPALMLPSGLGRSGLPTGIQIVGRPGADALCLKAGIAFQQATSHHLNAPAQRTS